MNQVNQPTLRSPICTHISRLLDSCFTNQHYELSIPISNYQNQIKGYYSQYIKGDIFELCEKAGIANAFGFHSFGLVIEFKSETICKMHNEEKQLISQVKELVRQFGVVIFRNVVLHQSIKGMCHQNNFPHLNFHTDRGEQHENKYSLYTRDPYDIEQKSPRKASTIFIDNSVAYLQAYVEKQLKPGEVGRRGHYDIFRNSDLSNLFGKIILEQSWSAPTGVGEICIINNNCVLHSSYKHGSEHGYYIGARYLY